MCVSFIVQERLHFLSYVLSGTETLSGRLQKWSNALYTHVFLWTKVDNAYIMFQALFYTHSGKDISVCRLCFLSHNLSPFLSLSIYLFLSLSIYIYIYIYVCVCVCVCVCARARLHVCVCVFLLYLLCSSVDWDFFTLFLISRLFRHNHSIYNRVIPSFFYPPFSTLFYPFFLTSGFFILLALNQFHFSETFSSSSFLDSSLRVLSLHYSNFHFKSSKSLLSTERKDF